MEHLEQRTDVCNSFVSPAIAATRQEYLLSEIRCAKARAQLLVDDIGAVELALRGGLISPEQAVEHLHDRGCLDLIGAAS
jgi:hypothetical protein